MAVQIFLVIVESMPLLIDLTVQGQSQQLSTSSSQLEWLDRLGGDALTEGGNNIAIGDLLFIKFSFIYICILT